MAVLKNKTKKENFLVVSKIFLQDKKLSLAERGLLATMHSLPEDWNFTLKGMAKLIPDGEARIGAALTGLVNKGYVSKKQSKENGGKFGQNVIEIYERPLRRKPLPENPITEKPLPGKPVPENRPQYNINKYNTNQYSINQSINQETTRMDGQMDESAYRKMVAENIQLDNLLEVAGRDQSEVNMVNEIYGVICEMVIYPRDKVEIKGVFYPWDTVKAQYLKLTYKHVAALLNRLIDENLGIKNMHAYLISALYTQSLVNELELQASISDDYLKYMRGNRY